MLMQPSSQDYQLVYTCIKLSTLGFGPLAIALSWALLRLVESFLRCNMAHLFSLQNFNAGLLPTQTSSKDNNIPYHDKVCAYKASFTNLCARHYIQNIHLNCFKCFDPFAVMLEEILYNTQKWLLEWWLKK